MTWVDLVRVVKMVAVGCFFAGCFGALLPHSIEDRRRFAYLVAGPSVGVVWAMGFVLAPLLRHSLLHTWTIGGFALSLVSLQAVLYAVGREGRRTWRTAAVVIVPLVLTVVLMVLRPP